MTALCASMLMMFFCLTADNAFAKTKSKHSKSSVCCVMKDGKMMCMKSGKMVPMDKDMMMKNGTKCTASGECIMKNGEKIQMKDGECMDMKGKMDKCDMMDTKSNTGKAKDNKHDKAVSYTCPMHADVTSTKPGQCSKCGMDLEKKK